MKTLFNTIILLFLSSFLYAQAPELMNYQAVVTDANDAPIENGSIGIRISILQGSETGTAVYVETHMTTTNDNGLITLNIGAGTTSNDFSVINWSTGLYYIKSEIDPTGGTNYTVSGTSQLLSVPYALYANNVSNSGGGNQSNNSETISSFAFSSNSTGTTYAFHQSTGMWIGQSGIGGIVASNGNFVFMSNSTGTTYAFSQSTGTWIGQSGVGSIVASNGNFALISSSTGTTYVFNQNTGTWVGQSGIGSIVASNGSFAFSSNSTGTTYAFHQSTGTWVGQSGVGGIVASNGNFAFTNNSAGTTYAFSQSTGTWIGQSGIGSIVVSESN